MTRSDPKRSVLVSNTSRANLELYTYIVTENDSPQDKLPFRLYLRFYDVRPPICPCVTAYESDSYRESSASSSVVEDVETGVELFLGADCGQQDYSYYKVEPSELMLERGCTTKLKVTLESSEEYIPAAGVIIRAVPVDKAGPCWCRPGVPAQFLSLVQVNRVPKLEVSCSRVYIKLSALELPMNDVLRTRKKLFIQNTGSASLEAKLVTEAPWSVVVPQKQCHMRCLEKVPGADVMGLNLPPASSAEVSMEVSVITKEVWPKPGQVYAKRRSTTSYLRCFNKQQVLLMSIPLMLEIEFPIISTQPSVIDFGFVMDGDTRKTYFTVMHSSTSDIIEVLVQRSGDEGFTHWPRRLVMTSGCRRRVYVQYTARWKHAPSECSLRVQVSGGAGTWCACSLSARAQSSIDRATRLPVHDYTDDTKILPPM
ncbi:uncharacterized protein LOC126973436 [Leptidea sinapis]|uniref:uncharacterized protein LOC126973436 n=1 Tax=Leptidea sinapis TaxID=189913 RepID=UPI0021C2E247|nr:uncharacterized protein LOC126973436 [Leptidea sinapis]